MGLQLEPILKQYQYNEAIKRYLSRFDHKSPYPDKKLIYPLNKAGIWEAVTYDESKSFKCFYKGKFSDCLLEFILSGEYFGGWVPETFDQIDNCNNGTLRLSEPVKHKIKVVKHHKLDQ